MAAQGPAAVNVLFVRFDRNPETLETSVGNFYAIGEGAGMAGGITSSAVDGIRIAEAMLKNPLR